MKKYLIVLFSVFALTACESGLASAQTPIAVTAATLVGTYAANELRGDLQFQGQVVRVTGRVDDIARTILGTPYIRLSAGRIDTPRGVTCTLASTAVEAAAVESTTPLDMEKNSARRDMGASPTSPFSPSGCSRVLYF